MSNPADTSAQEARMRALGYSDAEIRLVLLGDRADGYRSAHGVKKRRREEGLRRRGAQMQPLTVEQAATARSYRSAGMTANHIAEVMRVHVSRVRRELGA